ncbi:MAG: alcohol dehydrogenase catalytic domain-containing protein, partial [Acidimicrobiales bacterium]
MTRSASTQPAAVLVRPGLIELVDVPVPEPAENEVLVAVSQVGLCGSDAHYFQDGRIGDFVVRSPLILGHEAAGTVVACG